MFTRGSGVLLHITSLPSRGGIGDLGEEAFRFADLLAKSGQKYWQVLPLNPVHSGGCYSPYFSASALAGNPLLISFDQISGTAKSLPENFILSDEGRVDFDAVNDRKFERLASLYTEFVNKGGSSGFDAFCTKEKKWIDDYALFMVLKRTFSGLPWNRWPAPFKHRNPDALKKAKKEHAEALQREKWYQYLFFTQWEKLKAYCNSKAIRMIGDIPIYVSYDSVDVWTHPEMFKLNADLDPVGVSGVPPDYFSATGQLWNNPVYHWDAIEKTGFSWWVERMRQMFRRFDIVRIDHFRGLVNYWEVPAGSTTAINGSWQPVPVYQLFDTLQKKLPGFPVIAEDLGIITDDVREAMQRYNFPGMKVLLFAFGDEQPQHPYLPHMYERNSVVYTGTHDNNTIRGWYENEADAAVRSRFQAYSGDSVKTAESAVDAMLRLALSSVADLAIVNMQDILGLDGTCRMNTPSTIQGNWTWKLTKKNMAEFPVDKLRDMTRRYGRL